jgi:signal transduction histidine kinase
VHGRAWLNDAVEAWQPVAAASATQIRLDWQGPDGVVRGRQSRLAQVTGNLIANAIDHGRGVVDVVGRVEGGAVVIDVTDDGPGLPAPVATWLMGPVHNPRGREWGRRGVSGRGHGLRIARAVAEVHGGRLTVGRGGPGARLILTLPLAGR